MKSILTGAAAICDAQLELPYELPDMGRQENDWAANELVFAVREPFPSKTSSASLVHGHIYHQNHLHISSHMAEHGVIFSDGIEADYLEFNAGLTAEISVADKRGYLVV